MADFSDEAEAYWGLVLCKYGIEYVDDPATGKKIPTCHRSSYDSVLDDSNLEQAVENADLAAQKIYRDEAKQIERIRKGILEVSSAEQPYDIFICYKETAANGDRTLDSVLAQDLYSALTDKGYWVFFSRITLQGKLGEAYEPYIFAALNSAKVMLAVGTSYEYYNAVWVKNEWSRYLKLCESDKSKHLIPCFKDLDPEDMPKEFSHLQGADLGKMGAIQDVLFNMEKYIPLKKQTVVQKSVVVGNGGSNKIDVLLERGNMALEDGDWAKADSFFEDVLNNDAKNAQAYLGKALAQEKCRTIDAFARKRKNLYETAKEATLKIPVAEDHIQEMTQKWTLPGYVEQNRIQKLYQFQLSYPSLVQGRRAQYQNEQNYWTGHKQLARVEQFAQGALAETLQKEKKNLFTQLADRVKQAEVEETAAREKLQQEYDAHIRQADKKAEDLYKRGLQRREQEYQDLLLIVNTESDISKLSKAAKALAALGDYQDSKSAVRRCRERIAEEQAKLAAQVEADRIAAKKAAKAKKRKVAIVVVICFFVAIGILMGTMYVTMELIPKMKHEQAVEHAQELLAQGNYEEAIDILSDLQEEELLLQALLVRADAIAESGDYWDAGMKYMMLYEDHGLEEALEKYNALYYEKGVEYMEAGDYDSASSCFAKTSGYKDTDDLAEACNYRVAMVEFEDHSFDYAADYFEAAGDYEDAAQMAIYCRARELANDDLMAAEELLLQLPREMADVDLMLTTIEQYREWPGTFDWKKITGNNAKDYTQAVVRVVYEQDRTMDEPRLEIEVELFLSGRGFVYSSDGVMPVGNYFEFTHKFENDWEKFILSPSTVIVHTYDEWTYGTGGDYAEYRFEKK